MVQNGEEGPVRWVTTRRCRAVGQNKTLYACTSAAVRPGDQPADRPDPRRAGHVAGVLRRSKPNLLNTNDINPPIRLEVTQPVLTCAEMAKLRNIEKYTSGKFRSFELDICYPVAWGKDGIEARLACWRLTPRRTLCVPVPIS